MTKTLELSVDRIGPEREESTLRVVLALTAVVFFCAWLPQPTAVKGMAVCGVYALVAVALWAAMRRVTRPSSSRRAAALVLDQLSITCALWVAGPPAAPLLFGYLWVILGASTRYGVRYAAGTAACAVLGLGFLFLHEPGWRANAMIGSWLVVLAVAPFYAAVLSARVVRRYREHSRQLAIAATHDRLTGLPNRDHFERALEGALEQLRIAAEGAVAVLFVDLDGFKTCNDLYGHAAGDEVLRMIAEDLRSSIRASDIAARFGGDEFAILLTGLRSVEDASRIVSTIIRRAQEARTVAGQTLRISASAGICYVRAVDANELDMPAVIARADRAMLRAKRSGKNTFRVATGPQTIVREFDRLKVAG
jgi:diguanylate cyclase (GGDEF)-like protein